MNRYLTLLSVTCLAAGLCAGCSSTKQLDKSYLKDAQTINPVAVPAGANRPKIQPYYATPAVTVPANYQPPSIVPPGSDLARYKKTNSQSQTNSQARSQTTAAVPALPQPAHEEINS